MSQSFVVQRVERPGLTFIKVSGTIDETFNREDVLREMKGDAIFHLGRINRFGSVGVREWIGMMREVKTRLRKCVLVECSRAVVDQLNMVVDFAGGAHVKSVQLPYTCENCHREAAVVVDVDANRSALLGGALPVQTCPNCGTSMTFDDVPETYLGFLQDAATPPEGSAMAAFIAQFEKSAPTLDDLSAGSGSSPGAVPTAPPPGEAPAPAQRSPSSPGSQPGVAPGVAAAQGADSWGDSIRSAMGSGPLMVAGGVAALTLALVVVAIARPRPEAVRVPPAPPVFSPQPQDTAPQTPPNPTQAALERRPVGADELIAINGLLASEKFSEAEAQLKELGPNLTEESVLRLGSLVHSEQVSASNRHLTRAKRLAAEGRVRDALDELRLSGATGVDSEELYLLRVLYARRAGDCQLAIHNAQDFLEKYDQSPNAQRVLATWKMCGVATPSPSGSTSGSTSGSGSGTQTAKPPDNEPEPEQVTPAQGGG